MRALTGQIAGNYRRSRRNRKPYDTCIVGGPCAVFVDPALTGPISSDRIVPGEGGKGEGGGG